MKIVFNSQIPISKVTGWFVPAFQNKRSLRAIKRTREKIKLETLRDITGIILKSNSEGRKDTRMSSGF